MCIRKIGAENTAAPPPGSNGETGSAQRDRAAGDSLLLGKKETCWNSFLSGLRAFCSFLMRLFCRGCFRSEQAQDAPCDKKPLDEKPIDKKPLETATQPPVEQSEKDKLIDKLVAPRDGDREALRKHLLKQTESFIKEGIVNTPDPQAVLDKLSGRSQPPRTNAHVDEPIDLTKGKEQVVEEILKRWGRLSQWEMRERLLKQSEDYLFNLAKNPSTIRKVLDELGGFDPAYFSQNPSGPTGSEE